MVDEQIPDKAHQQTPGTACAPLEEQPVEGGRHLGPQQQGKHPSVVCRGIIKRYVSRFRSCHYSGPWNPFGTGSSAPFTGSGSHEPLPMPCFNGFDKGMRAFRQEDRMSLWRNRCLRPVLYLPIDHRTSKDGFATLSRYIDRQNALFDVGRSDLFTCGCPGCERTAGRRINRKRRWRIPGCFSTRYGPCAAHALGRWYRGC